MKNILLLIDSLGSGGAQNQITMLAVNLVKKGYSVTLVVYFKNDFFKKRVEEGDVNLVFIPKKGKAGINVIRGLIKTIKENNIGLLISFLHTPNFYGAVSKLILRSKIILITSYRSKTDISKLSFIDLSRLKWINNISNLIITNSIHEKERWIDKYPYLRKKMYTIYNGVSKAKFSYLPDVERNNTLLVVGSVGPAKNGLVIIKALKYLVDKGCKINVLWIGRKVFTLEHRKRYLEKMQQQIDVNNLSDFWTWKEPIPNIEKCYQSNKAMILASEVEGLPNVVCEAQSCGMPCIVSDTLDHPLLITEGVNGYLFDPKDHISLAIAIEKLYSLSPEEENEMRKNSFASANEKFSENKYISSFINLIEND